jgi:hypothetical protein
MKIRNQGDVDKVLQGNPAKHLRLWWNALPLEIKHTIQFTCVSGVHRPDPAAANAGWIFDKKVMAGGQMEIVGALPSTWVALAGLATLTVDSQSGPTSLAPFLDFSTSHSGVFSGLDLRGLHCVSAEGQVFTIHDHTNDRLFTTKNASPTATTISVARPSTSFRASLDDVAAPYASGCFIATLEGSPTETYPFGFGELFIRNILFEPFSGGSSGYSVAVGVTGPISINIEQCLRDFTEEQILFSRVPNGRVFQVSSGQDTELAGGINITLCGVRSTPGAGGADEPVVCFSPVRVGIQDTIIYGCRDNLFFSIGTKLLVGNMVIRKCGDLTNSALEAESSEISFREYTTFFHGCGNIITDERVILRNCKQLISWAGMHLQIGDQIAGTNGGLVLEGGTKLDSSQSTANGGIRDLGGNLNDVGIQLIGARNDLLLRITDDLTGVVNDVESDGATFAYGDITGTVAAPDITLALNAIGRG